MGIHDVTNSPGVDQTPDGGEPQDLHELLESKRALEARNDHLFQLYKTAHQFVDHVSHEFRTPLTVIKEFSTVIRDELAGPITDEQRRYLEIVIGRVDDLIVMVNDMLDISRIENGGLVITRGVYRVADIVDRMRTTLERRAESSEVDLQFHLPEDLPRVYCDGEKIGRVIVNLVVNALKFSSPGETVHLRARHEAESSQVVLDIEDHGPGIAPEHVQMIFDRFSQVHGIRTSQKGFGLGLNIVKELVQMNFGEVTIESELNKGSTFSFTIPTTEPRRLMERYLASVGEVRDGLDHVAILEVSVDAAVRAQSNRLDDLQDFLYVQMRRSDLLFRHRPGRWLMVVATHRPQVEPIVQRYAQARIDTNKLRIGSPLPEFEMTCLGKWEIAVQRESFIDSFTTQYQTRKG
jgi:nitrogen-specific signal transduction histidine kinase